MSKIIKEVTEAVELPLDAASNCTDNQSETESISEEERVRRLFAICDADGDGFIDSQDLVTALQELGLDGVVHVDDLMNQMGADSDGKVSYEQFLQCRLSHKSEIEALRSHNNFPSDPTHALGWMNSKDLTGLLTTSSEHSLGAASGRQESWEFDSGARDLSPEPHSLHKLIEAAGGSLHAGNTSLLDLANKLHLAALGSLKGEITELHARLQRTTHERDTLEQALATTQLERLRLVQESEERLERQSTQYEERLTELHSVIAELTRKLNRQQYNVIKEEGEGDEEEEVDDKGMSPTRDRSEGSRSRSDADGDVIDAAAGHGSNAHGAGRSSSDAAAGYSRLERENQDVEQEDEDGRSSCSSDLSFGASSSEAGNEDADNQAGEDDLDAKAVQAGENLDQFLQSATTHPQAVKGSAVDPRRRGSFEEHLMALNAENRELRDQLHRLNLELTQARQAIDLLRNERDEWRKKLDANASVHPRPLPLSAAAGMGAIPVFGSGGSASPVNRVASPVVVEEGPVCKVAERVRIKRLDGRDRLLTGSQIASLGVRDARVAEQLVSSLHQESSEGESRDAVGAAAKVRELELEVERLSSRAEHLRAQNDVLSLTLSESRAMGERLAVLLGKYESNCMALRLALERADRVSEAFEALVALVESEMSLLLANCQMAGIGLAGGRSTSGWEDGSNDWSSLWKRATERRRSSENLARCLLARHDKDRDHWDDSGRHTSTTSSTSSGAESGSGSGSNPATTLEPTERKVRDLIIRLKADRANLEGTVQQVTLPLESALVDPLPKEMLPLAEARKMDLEMAVIMQELMAMREERSRLRARVYLLEKERTTSEAQHQTHLAQIKLLQTQMGIVDLCEAEDVKTEGSTLGPEERERRMQVRIHELVSTVERVTQNAELRQQQSAELVNDVKKANATLVQLLEKAKKKYQNRLKRMEHQILNMSERHAMQIRLLKQKMPTLDDESSQTRNQQDCPSSAPSETSL